MSPGDHTPCKSEPRHFPTIISTTAISCTEIGQKMHTAAHYNAIQHNGHAVNAILIVIHF